MVTGLISTSSLHESSFPFSFCDTEDVDFGIDYCVFVVVFAAGLLHSEHGGKPQARLLGAKVPSESPGTLISPAALS